MQRPQYIMDQYLFDETKYGFQKPLAGLGTVHNWLRTGMLTHNGYIYFSESEFHAFQQVNVRTEFISSSHNPLNKAMFGICFCSTRALCIRGGTWRAWGLMIIKYKFVSGKIRLFNVRRFQRTEPSQIRIRAKNRRRRTWERNAPPSGRGGRFGVWN